MGWFTRVVTSAYAWSDLIMKKRQDKANRDYKIQKAEREARQIMREHQKKLQENSNSATILRKRDYLLSLEE